MKNEISKQQTIRFKDKNLVDKLNEEYLKSKFTSINEFFNFCLESYLNSQIDTKKQIEEIHNILQEKNLSNDKYEKEIIYILKRLLEYVSKNMNISLRELGLLRQYIFGYPLDEEKFDKGIYDESQFNYKEVVSE